MVSEMGTFGKKEQIKALMENIKNDLDSEGSLNEMKLILSTLTDGQLKECTSDVPLEVLFDALNSSNRTQIATACDVLRFCLTTRDSSSFHKFTSHLTRALNHPEKCAKELALKTLIDMTKKNFVFRGANGEDEMILGIISCLCDENVSVGDKATALLTEIGKTGWGISMMCKPKLVQELVTKTDPSAIYKIRLAEVATNIGIVSEDRLKLIETTGLLRSVISVLQSDDTLAILSTIEVVAPLAATHHGLEFLGRHTILKILTEKLLRADVDPMESLVYPGLSRFFASVGRNCPEELIAYCPSVLATFFKHVDSSDTEMLVTSLEAISHIASSPLGKFQMRKYDRYMKNVMSQFLFALVTLQTEWRVRCLEALGRLLHYTRFQKPVESLEIISGADYVDKTNIIKTEQWFGQLGPTGLQVIVDLAKQPFLEIKIAAFNVLNEIARQKWGQKKIYTLPDLMPYLLDRTDESLHEGRIAKFEVVKIMVETTSFEGVVNNEQELAKLQEFVRQGPNYKPMQLQVAVEGAD